MARVIIRMMKCPLRRTAPSPREPPIHEAGRPYEHQCRRRAGLQWNCLAMPATFIRTINGQTRCAMLNLEHSFMSFLQRVRFMGVLLGLAGAVPSTVFAQSGYVPNGLEYPPAGFLPGDQTRPAIALTPTNGFLVWQDNITDGDGLGISAQALDGTFSPVFGVLRINQIGAGDQERPQVAILNNG